MSDYRTDRLIVPLLLPLRHQPHPLRLRQRPRRQGVVDDFVLLLLVALAGAGGGAGGFGAPFFNVVTPGPTSTTTPAPSCPKMAGKSPSGSAPLRVNSSV